MLEEGRPFVFDLDPTPGGPDRVALPPPGGVRGSETGNEPPRQ